MKISFSSLFAIAVIVFSFAGCEGPKVATAVDNAGSYGQDVKFLKKYDKELFVLTNGESSIAVSPKYQAKVFTSSASGMSGKSFGWINYKAFGGPLDNQMNAYGGENRIWLGPEGGKFSLFFAEGDSMIFDKWKTPPAFDSESWGVVRSDKKSVEMRQQMQLDNYAGTRINLVADRTVTLLTKPGIESLLGYPIPPAVKSVGYRTDNKITNTGNQDWSEATGMPCIWILDMLTPSPATTIMIPFLYKDGKFPATTNYFGEIPASRLKIMDSTILFKGDGQMRGKLGVHPDQARPVAGSYDAEAKVLTIAKFDTDNGAQYLNQEWVTNKPVFSGDAVNAYNDGPLADGRQLGPFYEIESVSPAAALQKGASLTHMHAVFHFTGEEQQLDLIANRLLGVHLKNITEMK